MPSGPWALWACRPDNSFSTPFTLMLPGTIVGKEEAPRSGKVEIFHE